MNVLFILPTAEKHYQRYLHYLFHRKPKGLSSKITLTSPRNPVYLSKLKGIDVVVTNSDNILRKLSGVTDPKATCYQYQGSVIEDRGIKFLILYSFKMLAFDTSYTLQCRMYMSKVISPWLFPEQPPLEYVFLDNIKLTDLDNPIPELCQGKEPWVIAADIETKRVGIGMTLCGYTFVFSENGSFTYKTVVVPYKSEEHHRVIAGINASKYPKIFHNGIYDNSYFLRWGCPVNNYLFDTQYMFQSWVHDWQKSLGFITMLLVKDAVYWKDGRKSTTTREKVQYNARDCYYTALCFQALLMHMPEWAWDTSRKKIRRAHLCIEMNIKGMRVDTDLYVKTGNEFAYTKDTERNKLIASVGHPNYNPGSPKQVKQFLQILAGKRLKLTNADVKAQDKVKALGAIESVFVDMHQEVAKISKLHSTYFQWEPLDGRLLYSLNPSSTTSDRFGCSAGDFWVGQQIQNFPPEARKPIIADKGMILGSCDLPQSESRFTAYESQDENLIHAVENAKDFHTHNASMFFGMPEEQITKILRTLAKRVNHGANYNMGSATLLATMGTQNVLNAKRLLKLNKSWSLKQVCTHLLDLFKETYPRIKGSSKVPMMRSWYGEMIKEVATTGKVVAGDGWTKMFFGNPAKNKLDMNNLASVKPQHGNAEYTNRGLEAIYRELVEYGEFEVLAQVHDEIVFQVKIGMEDYYGPKVVECMTHEWEINGRKFTVVPDQPVWGNSWYDIH